MDPKSLLLLAVGVSLIWMGAGIVRRREVEWRPGLVSQGRAAVAAGVGLIAIGVAWDVAALLLIRALYADRGVWFPF